MKSFLMKIIAVIVCATIVLPDVSWALQARLSDERTGSIAAMIDRIQTAIQAEANTRERYTEAFSTTQVRGILQYGFDQDKICIEVLQKSFPFPIETTKALLDRARDVFDLLFNGKEELLRTNALISPLRVIVKPYQKALLKTAKVTAWGTVNTFAGDWIEVADGRWNYIRFMVRNKCLDLDVSERFMAMDLFAQETLLVYAMQSVLALNDPSSSEYDDFLRYAIKQNFLQNGSLDRLPAERRMMALETYVHSTYAYSIHDRMVQYFDRTTQEIAAAKVSKVTDPVAQRTAEKNERQSVPSHATVRRGKSIRTVSVLLMAGAVVISILFIGTMRMVRERKNGIREKFELPEGVYEQRYDADARVNALLTLMQWDEGIEKTYTYVEEIDTLFSTCPGEITIETARKTLYALRKIMRTADEYLATNTNHESAERMAVIELKNAAIRAKATVEALVMRSVDATSLSFVQPAVVGEQSFSAQIVPVVSRGLDDDDVAVLMAA